MIRERACGAIIRSVEVVRSSAVSPYDPGRFAEGLAGQRIIGVERRAKNILLYLSNEEVIRVHLRMTGHFYVIPNARLQPTATRLAFHLSRRRALILDDPRAFGRVTRHTAADLRALLDAYGPEPLSDAFTPAVLADAARRSRGPAKVFLMDQSRIAGLGNIWAAESLFAARIHPATPMNHLSAHRIRRLHAAIVAVLHDAVQSALVIVQAYPSSFPDADLLNVSVYQREGQPCVRCGRSIERMVQAGRSTYFCPRCQRP